MYEQRFKELLVATAKGFGVGAIISLALVFILGLQTSVDTLIVGFIIFLILAGSVVSIIICAKSGMQGFMSGAVIHLWNGMTSLFFSSILGGSAALFILGIIRLAIGFIIMIPVGLYMAVSYFLNLIYLGIMALMEKKNKLEDKANLCQALDKAVPVISFVIVAIFCVLIIQSM